MAKKSNRVKAKCEAYQLTGTKEKNKKRKLEKHLKRFPDDQQAQKAL